MAAQPSPGIEGEKLALAVRHVHFEDCGTLGDVLVERGFTVRYLEAGRDALNDIDVSTADLVISLGGPVGVYDCERYPWIRDELKLIERSLAALLASTPEVSHQVFEWGNRVLAFQCHPEIRVNDIEAWLIGQACEIAATPGANVEQLRHDTARFAPALARQSRRAFNDWLTSVGL